MSMPHISEPKLINLLDNILVDFEECKINRNIALVNIMELFIKTLSEIKEEVLK